MHAQLTAGQLAHAYILSGEDAENQAICLSAALFCLGAEKNGKACGTCPSCKNVAANTHPDLVIIDHGQALQHKVEQMRTVVSQSGFSPLSGERKVFIIRHADKMTEEAANTLLKQLEEPAANIHFILLADAPDSLLPTIISRCQLFVCNNTKCQECSDDKPYLFDDALDLIQHLPKMHLYEVLIRAREYEKDKDAFKSFIFALLYVCHQACIAQIKLPISDSYLIRLADMLDTALQMIDKNVNQKLLSDVIYLRLWQSCQQTK